MPPSEQGAGEGMPSQVAGVRTDPVGCEIRVVKQVVAAVAVRGLVCSLPWPGSPPICGLRTGPRVSGGGSCCLDRPPPGCTDPVRWGHVCLSVWPSV